MKTSGKALNLLVAAPASIDATAFLAALSPSVASSLRVETLETLRAALVPLDAPIESLPSGSPIRSASAVPDALLIFPDAALPLESALDIARNHGLPAVLAGEWSAEAVASALRAGAADYVSPEKPANLSAIVEREKRLLGERRADLQKRNELTVSEERYRAITESIFDLICELDGEGRAVYLSPNYATVLGYNSSELLGKPIFDRVHPDDREAAIRAYATALSGRGAGNATFRLKAKNGEHQWFEATLRSIRTGGAAKGAQGGARRVVQISRDITTHKRHEDELAALIALAKAINSRTQLPEISCELWNGLQELLPFDSLFIALRAETLGEAGDELCLVQCNTRGDASEHLTREANGAHPVWQAVDRNETWLVNDWNFGAFGINGQRGIGTRAFLSVPLRVDGRNWGVLFFDSARPYVFTEEHARLASMVGEQVAVAARQTQILGQARAAKERFRNLVNDVDAIVWEADASDSKLTYISPQVEQWLGYAPERLMYDSELWRSLIHPDDRENAIDEMRRAIAAGEDYQIDYRVTAAGGRVIWLRNLVNVETRENIAGVREAVKLIGVSVDITERMEAHAALHESNAILRATQESVADGICVVDERGAVVSFNARFCEMWRIGADLVDEMSDRRQLMACVLSALSQPEEFVDKMNFLAAHSESQSRDEVRLKNGQIFERYSAPAIAPDGRSFGRVWTWSDISERKGYEEQLAHQAFHDALTDLPNRTLFVDRVNHAIAHLERIYPAIAVLFMDLDRFKVVNDSMGHATGDLLLCQVASRLQNCMRPGDTAARFGGDEFTLLLENINGTDDAIAVTERLLECLNDPFVIDGRELYVSSSVGIAVSQSREDRADDLLRNADIAMYRAKNKGKARFEVFDTKMSAHALEKLQLEIELRQAVKWKQLHLDYQPLIDLETQRIIGVEALVRWNHPQRGLVSPADFIPIAEESGMIVSIGRWVLREACEQARRWQLEIPIHPPLKMSVNLSAKQFQQSNLIEDVETVLKETGLPASCLELEITESAIMEDAEATITQLETLKKLGVTLAIDDFGTGYSSLAYVERFPLDVLKIDRSFVKQIGLKNGVERKTKDGKNSTRNVVMQAVSTLGVGLGVRITAEGIETAEQLDHLRELGCDIGQGFLFARPLSSGDLQQMLHDRYGANGHNGNGHANATNGHANATNGHANGHNGTH